MAICDDHPGLRAEIVVDGQALKEYDDEEAAPNTITKYIEASSGKCFAMKMSFDPPFPTRYGVEVRVSVDGASGRKISYAPDQLYTPAGHVKSGVSFQENGRWFRQNYCFTALNIVEEADSIPSVADFKKDLDSKGSIKLSFRFITNRRPTTRQHRGTPVDDLKAMAVIPEKVLKGDARSHQTTLSIPRPTRPRHPCSAYDYVDVAPFATFCFKYRSLASLKALQLIRDDEGDEDAVSVEDKPEDEMTPGQLREALRRARRREEESRRVKQESNMAHSVKREYADIVHQGDEDDEITVIESRSRKRPRGEPEVIVLD